MPFVDSAGWIPPSDAVTAPDQISPGALDQLGLLSDERIQRVWKTARGFLVMTNLRLIDVWYKAELFAKSEWHLGSSFFFYNLEEPRVVLGRYLELAEEYEESGGTLRFHVAHPAAVAAEIDAARLVGRKEWEARRLTARASARPRLAAVPESTPVVVQQIVREVVKIRCSYCGTLMDVTSPNCPACGAANTLADALPPRGSVR